MGFAMAKGKGKKGEGFHSAAGLIRYFDAEDETAMKIDPRMVLAFCVASIVVVEAVKILYPS